MKNIQDCRLLQLIGALKVNKQFENILYMYIKNFFPSINDPAMQLFVIIHCPYFAVFYQHSFSLPGGAVLGFVYQ